MKFEVNKYLPTPQNWFEPIPILWLISKSNLTCTLHKRQTLNAIYRYQEIQQIPILKIMYILPRYSSEIFLQDYSQLPGENSAEINNRKEKIIKFLW